jgi:glycerol transport system ATP-binding protein
VSLIAEHLTLEVDGVRHLDDVSFTLKRGRLHTLIGRTLAGKTTLLRTIAGLQRLDDGTLDLDGQPFHLRPVWERDVAMVYEEFINYPHLTVLDNVTFPLRRRGVSRDAARERARAALERVSLTGFDDRRPARLSGGQQQRVALARALVRNADVLLLDEPLANLDYKLREQMREEFRSLFSDQGGSVVLYTTTDPAEAMILGDDVLVMHEGRLIQVGPPDEVVDRPATTAVAAIVNDPPMNIVDGVIEDGTVRIGGTLSLPPAAHVRGLSPGRYLFGMRAMELGLGSDDDVKGAVTFSEVSGSETFVHVETGFGLLVLQIEGVQSFALDTSVPVLIDPERLFVFGPDGRLVAYPKTETGRPWRRSR